MGKVRKAWNFGLSKESDVRVARNCLAVNEFNAKKIVEFHICDRVVLAKRM